MRRLSLFLCLTLFASFIHAGEIKLMGQVGHNSFLERATYHDCHAQQVLSGKEAGKSKSHQASYQCCMGVFADLSTHELFSVAFSNQLVPKVSELQIDGMPDQIFKPPKLLG